LTRQIISRTKEPFDEIQYSCDKHFGELAKGSVKDEQGWYEVSLVRAVAKCTFSIGNRGYVGAPLCRDKSYHRAILYWLTAFGLTTLIRRAFIPPTFQDLIMPFARLPQAWLKDRAVKYLLPEVRKRIVQV
jgi:hypothetical protein